MKTMVSEIVTAGFVAIALVIVTGCNHATEPAQSHATGERIGVYDSRAIAVAYAGSDAHEAALAKLKKRYDDAKAAGNATVVNACETEAQAQQRTMHLQGFGTAPVDDILAHISGELTGIMRKAGVVAIVSKWDEAKLAQYPNAGREDVTMALVDALHPTDRQRERAIDVQKHKPVPMDELERLIERGEI